MAEPDKGFVKLLRSVQNTKTYNNACASQAFLHCLLRANFCPVVVRGRHLNAGQFITSNKKFSDECGMSEMQMRRAISCMKTDGLIITETIKNPTNRPTNEPTINGMVVTVVNYGFPGTQEADSNERTDQPPDELWTPENHPEDF